MADKSGIEWTDASWNPIAGCTAISPGCLHCYAATMARRLEAMGQAKYAGTAERRGSVDVFTGRINVHEPHFETPLNWKKPRRIFVSSMSDLFHEAVEFDTIRKILDICVHAAMVNGHTLQILTKRAKRMYEMVSRYIDDGHLCGAGGFCRDVHGGVKHGFPPGIWLGISAEDQKRANERIPELLKCRNLAQVLFLSCEPLIGPVDLDRASNDCLRELTYPGGSEKGIDWVIVGGESGPSARPCDIEWIRSIVRQCRDAGTPVFVKQLGANAFYWDKCADGLSGITGGGGDLPWTTADKKGGDINEFPEDLRVRQFPEVAHA